MQPLIAALSLIGWPKREVDTPSVAEDAPALPRPLAQELFDSRPQIKEQRETMFAAFRRGSGPS